MHNSTIYAAVLGFCAWVIPAGDIQLRAQERATETTILKRNKEGVTAMDVHPSGNTILVGTGNNMVRAWDHLNDRIEFEIPMSREVFSVLYLPDGSFFLANAGPAILIHTEAGKYHDVLQGHNTAVWSMDTDASGTYLVTGTFSKEFNIWNVPEVRLIQPVKAHDRSVLSVCFSPDGHHIASGSLDETIQIHAFPSLEFEVSAIAHYENIYDLEYHPEGHLLASASQDRSIKLWDLETGQLARLLEGHSGGVFSISFSPDGLFLISGSDDQTIKLWEVQSGQTIYTFTGHEGPVNEVHFLPDGTGFASGSMDGTVRIWKMDPRIIVDYCCAEEFNVALESEGWFQPRGEAESKSEYKQRIEAQEAMKANLYETYYQKYIQRLKKK